MHGVIALLLPAMRAVAAAHRKGIVHRDIKPENLFVTHEEDRPAPTLKVLDFGISKLASRGPEQLTLTKTGSTIGTPMYMSFEQLSGAKDMDARTDVYAFGVILYEALTGRPPCEAETFTELIVKVATTAPMSPKELRGDIPTPLARVVQWAMAKDRSERIASIEALVRELEPFATREGFEAEMTLAGHTLPSLCPRAPTPSSNEARSPVALLRTSPKLGNANKGWRMASFAGIAGLLLATGAVWLYPRDPEVAAPASLPKPDAAPLPVGLAPPSDGELVPEAVAERSTKTAPTRG